MNEKGLGKDNVQLGALIPISEKAHWKAKWTVEKFKGLSIGKEIEDMPAMHWMLRWLGSNGYQRHFSLSGVPMPP